MIQPIDTPYGVCTHEPDTLGDPLCSDCRRRVEAQSFRDAILKRPPMPTDPTPPLTVRDVLAAWLTMVGEPRKPSITFTAEGDAVRKMEREILDALTAPTPPLMADAAREVVSAWAYVHRGHLAHCLKSEISDCGFCKDVNHLMEACESLGNAKAHAARTTELDVLKWARREDAAEMQQDEMRYAADLAQRTAERDALQARIDAANSVDGVTADDAPLMIDALAPAAAWVEGVQHGQEMALAALAAPTEG